MRTLIPVALLAAALVAPAQAADPGDPAKGYTIDTAGSTTALTAGDKGKLVITIHPQGAWHVDPRTPLRIDLSAPPGLALVATRLGKKDAAADSKPEAPRFEAPFTAVSRGNHEARAKLDFFVCSADACVKQQREVSFAVAVK